MGKKIANYIHKLRQIDAQIAKDKDKKKRDDFSFDGQENMQI